MRWTAQGKNCKDIFAKFLCLDQNKSFPPFFVKITSSLILRSRLTFRCLNQANQVTKFAAITLCNQRRFRKIFLSENWKMKMFQEFSWNWKIFHQFYLLTIFNLLFSIHNSIVCSFMDLL